MSRDTCEHPLLICLSVSCRGSFTRPDNGAAEIPEGSVQTSSSVMTHLVSSAVVGKRFVSTLQRLIGIFQGIKHKQTGWRRQSSHSWMELQLPWFWLIPTMRRTSECDHRDKNCTWRVQHKKRFWTSKGMLLLRRYCLTHYTYIKGISEVEICMFLLNYEQEAGCR